MRQRAFLQRFSTVQGLVLSFSFYRAKLSLFFEALCLSRMRLRRHFRQNLRKKSGIPDWFLPKKSMIDALEQHGEIFSTTLASRDGQVWHVVGSVSGSDAYLDWWPAQAQETLSAEEVPVPLWLCTESGLLIWRNALAAELHLPEPGKLRVVRTIAKKPHVYTQAETSLQPGRIIGHGLDVTETQELARSLQRIEASHREVLDRVRIGIAVFGGDRRLAYYNPALAQLWRLDPVWLDTNPEHRLILDVLREKRRIPEMINYPEWKTDVLSLYVRAGEVGTQKSGDEFPDEVWHIAGGTALHVLIRPHPDKGLIVLVEDVSDSLALEQRYHRTLNVQRATLDGLEEGVAVTGRDGRLQFSNPAFARLWDIAPERLASGPDLAELEEWCGALVGDHPIWRNVLDRLHHAEDGRSRTRLRVPLGDRVYDVGALRLPDGSTLLTTVDATDSDQIETALRERSAALASADQLKRAFLEHVSYRLRTPLASIAGFAEILLHEKTGDLNPRQRGYIRNILEASEELRVLIDDILVLGAVEAGRISLDRKALALDLVLSKAISLIAGRAHEHRLKVRTEMNVQGMIFGDASLLQQVFFNLLGNTLENAIPETDLWVRVEKASGGVEIRFEAQGRSPDDPERAFEAFYSRESGRIGHDSNLALALAQRLIALHGGSLHFDTSQENCRCLICNLPDSETSTARGENF